MAGMFSKFSGAAMALGLMFTPVANTHSLSAPTSAQTIATPKAEALKIETPKAHTVPTSRFDAQAANKYFNDISDSMVGFALVHGKNPTAIGLDKVAGLGDVAMNFHTKTAFNNQGAITRAATYSLT